MQVLNLARKDYGNVDYELIHFPDGQKHLRILSEIDHKGTYKVVCRLTNGDDLFVLMQVADILNRHCLVWELDIKYLLAARTDRLFSMSDAHSLNIVNNILVGLGATLISCYEPHNVDKVIFCAPILQIPDAGVYVAYPDKGARERYQDLFVDETPILCGKVRDELSGALTGFVVERSQECSGEHIVLLDDLCDGGGTFMGLEPKLRELNPTSLTLQVAHAIQLEGIKKVASVYDKVIITNSYADWDLIELPDNVEVVDVLR